MKISEIITKKLTDALKPSRLEVIDESHKHKGHVGAREGGETHFHLVIASNKFSGLSKIEQHRLVYEILKEEKSSHIHALSMETIAE